MGLSRKREVPGSEFPGAKPARVEVGAKRARVEVINIDDDSDDDVDYPLDPNDDYSLGFVVRPWLKLGNTKQKTTQNHKVRVYDIGPGLDYRWTSRGSEGRCVTDDSVRMFYGNGQENSYGVARNSTFDSDGMHFEYCCFGQGFDGYKENNIGVVTKAVDDSPHMFYEDGRIGQGSDGIGIGQNNSIGVVTKAVDYSARMLYEDCCVVQKESSQVAPEVECRRLDDSIDCQVVEDYNCRQETEVSKGLGIVQTEVAPEVECGRLGDWIDCQVVEDYNCKLETEVSKGLDVVSRKTTENDQVMDLMGQENSCGVSPELTNRMVFEKDNSIGVVTEAIDDSDCFIVQKESPQVAPEVEDLMDCQVVDDCNCKPETEVSKGLGVVSLTDTFTADQIREHLDSLEKPDGVVIGEDTCQLCAKDALLFTHPPMDCAHCLASIKPGVICYRTEEKVGAQYSFCNKCFLRSQDPISVKELSVSKDGLIKGKNDAESYEEWVACDKCERWQHQICALYNSKCDVEGKMSYTCPLCRLTERQAMPNVPVTPSLGARDLPRTILSDHLEQRLSKSLAHERKQRAEVLGKAVDEVPGAEDLVIRTVLAVDKQIKVNPQYLDILHGENYPSEFPYKSKVIMLFQKVEGAEVCLFAMYVQEFGSECGKPNQRSVYISYLDSVSYFTPDVRTVTHKQPLRTFVYHEILVGYLDYCKERGFETCYIWACPPGKGDDYILHCHPATQRMQKPERLRRWYMTMLKKAAEENVVSGHTNFHKHFFVSNGKITAANLPYFDGDFWSGTIQKTIGENFQGDPKKKKKPKKPVTKRTFKSMGYNDLSDDAAEDIKVMETLESTILPLKDDFFVVHLQFTCTNCHEQILSGNRWSCNQCKNFHLCERCIGGVQSHDGLRTHDANRGAKHPLIQIKMKDVAANTDDKDIIIDNGVFENRHAFLNLCQNNNYQFDTLRRAKHSTMMILYNLHKTAGSF